MDDLISRKAAIDAILAVTGNSSVRELYEHVQEHGLSEMWSGGVNAAIDIIIAVPSVQPEKRTEERTETHGACLDTISRQATIEWLKNEWNGMVTSLFDGIKALPSAQPDLSEYSDKLWKAAYERGKAEAQDEIVRCKECRHRDPEDHKCDCGHDIIWQLPRDDKWYCADAERRTDE